MDGRWPDSAKFEQFEPKRFYLRQNSVHRGAILKPAGEHGLAAPHLRPMVGNADRAVAPSRPLIRITYWQPGCVVTPSSWALTE